MGWWAVGADDIFGRMVSGADVVDAVTGTIRKWIVTYLAEVERHTGRSPRTLPAFRSYVEATEVDKDIEDQLPSCVVIVPGLFDNPRKNGDGTHDVAWSVAVGSIVSAKDRRSTMDLVKAYTLAVRALTVQQGALGGFAERTVWLEERYDEMAFSDERTIAAGITQHIVYVKNVICSAGGPFDVPADPYAPPAVWTTINDVVTTIGTEE